jgi:regulator of G-protein signaling
MIPTILSEDNNKIGLHDTMTMTATQIIVSESNGKTSLTASSPFKYIFKRGTDMKFHFGFLKRRHTDGSLAVKNSNTKTQNSSVRPGPEEAAKWANSFLDLMNSKYGQALFRAFLQRDFCEENIEFWLEVEDYRKTKQNKLNKKAQRILNEFIVPQSPKEINLDSITRESLISQLSTGPPTPNTFDQAQKRTQGLLESDAYQRFLKSELYMELVYPERYNNNEDVKNKY